MLRSKRRLKNRRVRVSTERRRFWVGDGSHVRSIDLFRVGFKIDHNSVKLTRPFRNHNDDVVTESHYCRSRDLWKFEMEYRQMIWGNNRQWRMKPMLKDKEQQDRR